MTNLTLKGSSYRVVNLIFYVAREREMGRGRERDGEREGKRWGEGGREMGKGSERIGEGER